MMGKVCSVFMRLRALTLLSFLAVSAAFSQSDNSNISGIVKDPSGATVANAKVTVRNEDTSFDRQLTTNGSGFFIATNLAPGYYTITVESAGFKKTSSSRNKLDAGLPLSINVDLTIGQISDTVTVEASAAQLNTESAVVGKTVEQKQIQNLTLNGRNPLFLALLKPGARWRPVRLQLRLKLRWLHHQRWPLAGFAHHL